MLESFVRRRDAPDAAPKPEPEGAAVSQWWKEGAEKSPVSNHEQLVSAAKRRVHSALVSAEARLEARGNRAEGRSSSRGRREASGTSDTTATTQIAATQPTSREGERLYQVNDPCLLRLVS